MLSINIGVFKLRIVGELLLSKELHAIKTTGFKNPVYCGDPLNISKIWADSGISEILFSTSTYSNTNLSYHKSPDEIRSPQINEFFSDYISNLKVPTSICVYPDLDNCKNLFDLGFDRVGFVVEPNKISLLKNVVNSLCTQYGGQALFLVFEVKDKKKVTNELEKFLNFAESFGVGEIIIKDVEADNNDLNFEFCERILAEVEKREILIGYSGGLKYEYKNKQLFQLFSCIVLGGDITLIKSNTVLPGF
jgi:imidazole glycerol phosphate synthase subunit HisF